MSQAEQILRVLKTGRPMTPMMALNRFGCFRLAARIADLRREGYRIRSRLMTVRGKRFAAYWMP